MIYYATASTNKVRAEVASNGQLGAINTPRTGHRLPQGVDWCADNGCFSAGYPGDDKFLGWLESKAHQADSCRFATAPDVVGDAVATLARSLPFLPKIRALGYPVAFVAQDGSTVDNLIPWGEFDVLFIGGSTEFKLGGDARAIVARAKDMGLWVHMGRVNSLKRLRYAQSIGCDSADGTFIAFAPDENLPKVQSWLRELRKDALWV